MVGEARVDGWPMDSSGTGLMAQDYTALRMAPN